jgi:hypothetical protein
MVGSGSIWNSFSFGADNKVLSFNLIFIVVLLNCTAIDVFMGSSFYLLIIYDFILIFYFNDLGITSIKAWMTITKSSYTFPSV